MVALRMFILATLLATVMVTASPSSIQKTTASPHHRFSRFFIFDDRRSPSQNSGLSDVIEKCKLQVTGKKDVNDLKYYENKQFFTSGNYVAFKQNGSNKRCELRQKAEWKTGTRKAVYMEGTLRLPSKLKGKKDRYTFMQIHGGKGAGKPLLRLVHVHQVSINKIKYVDWLWAYVRTGVRGGDVVKKKLIVKPSGDFTAKVKVQNNVVSVYINGKKLYSKKVAGSWKRYQQNHFKAGVNVKQSKDNVIVEYKKLKMSGAK